MFNVYMPWLIAISGVVLSLVFGAVVIWWRSGKQREQAAAIARQRDAERRAIERQRLRARDEALAEWMGETLPPPDAQRRGDDDDGPGRSAGPRVDEPRGQVPAATDRSRRPTYPHQRVTLAPRPAGLSPRHLGAMFPKLH